MMGTDMPTYILYQCLSGPDRPLFYLPYPCDHLMYHRVSIFQQEYIPAGRHLIHLHELVSHTNIFSRL